ncbi:DUF1552 domain-containing protein [Humisphaera borealis]|uniref:DUF1552 domain-containing protein n=1 Tax=Humisphaera borealis TaxID=2807512 RepID=A0A7M2X3V8_9BACT|nr:DUF1552 domain-containing protein [Humisphaera borealis]QOV92355.1 DUF1552 domain-containing protein [Humisphaera borealis]
MTTRRDFLKSTIAGTGAAMLPASISQAMAAPAIGQPPMRFIFMHKGNGLFPSVMVPPSLSKEDLAKENRKESFTVDLARHELPSWMSALNAHKEHMTILQGLSGKMCTTGHHTWQSSLGVYAANERLSSIKWATVDFELARMFPSPLEHIELACFPIDGGNARGNIFGIEKGFSARGPQQPNYAFGSPKVAINELFKAVSSNEADRVRYQLERKVLDFSAANQGGLGRELTGLELAKVQNYAVAMEDIRRRNSKLESMGDVIGRNLPKLDKKFLADDLTTIDCQIGHTEILLSALISGMTNVVAFTVDELGTLYSGVPGLEAEKINQHDVGHGKSVGTLKAEEVREAICKRHMALIDTIVRRLKSVPDGKGTLFDNTMLFYFPDNGETHHSTGIEWPYLVLSGRNAKLDIAGRYIRLPYWGTAGHKTIGNWFTTILNAYGNPIKHYGDLDLGLNKFTPDQTGPIRQFLS